MPPKGSFRGRLRTKEILSWETPHGKTPFVGGAPRKESVRGSLLTKGLLSWESRIDSSRGSSHEKNPFVGGPASSFLSWEHPKRRICSWGLPRTDSSRGSPKEKSVPGGCGCFYCVLFCTCASGDNGGGSGPLTVIFVTRRGSAEDPPLRRVVVVRLRGLSCTLPHKPAAAQSGHRASSRSFLKFAPSHLF